MVLAVDAAIFSTTYSSSSLGRSQPRTDRSRRQQLLPAATTAAFCNCFCSLETVASSSNSDCSAYLSGPTGTGCCSHLWFPAMSLHVSLLIRDSTSSFAYASLPPGTFPTCDYLELPYQIIQTHSKLTPEISFWGSGSWSWQSELSVLGGLIPMPHSLSYSRRSVCLSVEKAHSWSYGPLTRAPTPRGHKYSAYKQGLMTTQTKTLLPQICRDPQIPGDMSRCAVWADMRQFQKSNCIILDTKLFKMQWKNAYFHHHSHLKLSGQCKDAFIFSETVIVEACLWSQGRFGFTCKNSLVPPICLVTTQVDPPIPVACRNDIPWDCSRRCLSSHTHGYTPELWRNASLSPMNITCWWFSGFS